MEKNKLAAIIMGVGAVLILIGVITKGALTAGEGPISIGMGFWGSGKMCMGDKCESAPAPSFSDLKKGKDKAMLAFGKLAFIVGLVAFLVLAASAAMSFTANENAVKLAMPGMIVTAVALVCGVMFVLLKSEGLGIGWGFLLFLVGGIGGIVGSLQSKKAATGG